MTSLLHKIHIFYYRNCKTYTSGTVNIYAVDKTKVLEQNIYTYKKVLDLLWVLDETLINAGTPHFHIVIYVDIL